MPAATTLPCSQALTTNTPGAAAVTRDFRCSKPDTGSTVTGTPRGANTCRSAATPALLVRLEAPTKYCNEREGESESYVFFGICLLCSLSLCVVSSWQGTPLPSCAQPRHERVPRDLSTAHHHHQSAPPCPHLWHESGYPRPRMDTLTCEISLYCVFCMCQLVALTQWGTYHRNACLSERLPHNHFFTLARRVANATQERQSILLCTVGATKRREWATIGLEVDDREVWGG